MAKICIIQDFFTGKTAVLFLYAIILYYNYGVLKQPYVEQLNIQGEETGPFQTGNGLTVDHRGKTEMNKGIFISYRRDTGSAMARMIYDRLRFEKKYDCFLDVEKLSAGNFRKNIRAELSKCDIFLLVLSSKALDRCSNLDDNVRAEILAAKEAGLSFIPVTSEDFKWPEIMPAGLESLKDYNAIPYVQVYSEQFFERLYSFIENIRKQNGSKYENQDVIEEKTPEQYRSYSSGKARGTYWGKSNTGKNKNDQTGEAVPDGRRKENPLRVVIIIAVILGILTIAQPLLKSVSSAGGTTGSQVNPVDSGGLKELSSNEKIEYNGEDWSNALLMETSRGDAFVDYALDGKYSEAEFEYALYNTEEQDYYMNLILINADTGDVIETIRGVGREDGVQEASINVSGINILRIEAVSATGENAQYMMMVRDLTFLKEGDGKTDTKNKPVPKTETRLSSRATSNFKNYGTLDTSYIAFGKDWKGSHLFDLECLSHAEGFAEFDLNGEFTKLTFTFLPYRYADDGKHQFSLAVSDADTGDVLEYIEAIQADDEPKELEIDVTGVRKLRMTAKINNVCGSYWHAYSLIVKNEILE